MPVDDGVCDGRELTVAAARVCAQHLEGVVFVNRVTLHKNPLGALDQRAPAEGPLEVLELGETAQHDCQRIL